MLVSETIGTTQTTLYTAGDDGAVVVSMLFFNTHTEEAKLTFHACKVGDTATATNAVFEIDIPPRDTMIWGAGEKMMLGAGDFFSAISDEADKIVATLSIMEL